MPTWNDTRPTASTSSGQFQLPGLGVSSFPNPPAPNAVAANATLAQYPALRNLSQDELTALLFQIQNGQTQLPQLAQVQPSFPSTTNHLNVASQASSNANSRITSIREGPASNEAQSTGNSSLEEGEVSDASMELDSPVTSRPSPPAALKRKHDMTSPNSNRKAPRTSNGNHAAHDWIVQAMRYKEQVLPFILSLHHEGFSFSEILCEVQNENVLRNIYTELGLPLSKQDPVVSVSADPSTKGNDESTHRALPAVDRAATTAAVGNNSSKAAAPVNRSEYLARLSQLKAAKSATAASKDTSRAKSVMSQPPVQPNPQTTASKPALIPESPVQVVKEQDAAQNKKLNTERLKQKLEMLKAAEQKKRELAAAQASASALSEASESRGTGTPTQISVAPTDTDSARRRPVASDFLVAEAETPGFSRPFGQSRHNSDDDAMIIEASDDDSDDADDEADNEAVALNNDTNGFSAVQSMRRQRVGNFPPLTDFPPRSPFNRQASTSNIRTPAVQTPGALSEAEALLKHEQELAMLKIRIAEAEKRKKGATNKSGAVSDAVTGEVLQDIHSAVMQQAQTVDTVSSSGNATPLAPSELGSSMDSDKRTLLRAKLSARDIAASAKKARLAELQRQVELLQQEYEQDMLEQEQLREELEAFNVDTEGMSKEEMEAKKDEIIQQLESQTDSVDQQPTSVTTTQLLDATTSPQLLSAGHTADPRADVSSTISKSANEDESEGSSQAEESISQLTHPIEATREASTSSSATNTGDDESEGEDSMADVQPTDQDESSSRPTAEAAPETNVNDSDDEEVEMDMGDTSDESSESSSEESNAEESNEDSSDDDAPATSVTAPAPAQNELDDTSELVEDSDGDAPMDVSDDESDAESDDEADVEATEISVSSKEPSTMQTPLQSTKVSTPIPADDIAPELQYLEHPTDRPALQDTHATPFVPYEGSVLQQFKQFRCHPEYMQEVQGGYRSLRYSNNIDAYKTLCPNQGSVEVCKDPKCPFQHFRDMSLPGAY